MSKVFRRSSLSQTMLYTAFRLLMLAHASSCLQTTFEVHWGKHHRTYVNNLNNQIQGKDLESKSLEEVPAHIV